MQSRQKDEARNTGREEESGAAIELTPRRRQVVAVMERRGVSRGEEQENTVVKEGIKANRHKAIDRGRSSRSLMAWKNSESQANFALRLGAARGSCAPDTNVATNKEYSGGTLYVVSTPSTPPPSVLQRVSLSRCGRLNITTSSNDAESNSCRCWRW